MQSWHRIILGTIGGIVATGPMTAAMIVLHRRLPRHERYSLPPREITMKFARKTGVDDQLDSDARAAATMVSHFGYGAAAGSIYTALLEPRKHALTKGLLFGLLVWTASYLGWLPAAGILRSATEQPARRNLLMIGAHLIWGATLSSFVALLAEESEAGVQQPFSARNLPHADLAK
jgi:putative membrane protein